MERLRRQHPLRHYRPLLQPGFRVYLSPFLYFHLLEFLFSILAGRGSSVALNSELHDISNYLSFSKLPITFKITNGVSRS